MSSEWYYKDKVISSIEDMPKGTIGFVYVITFLPTGQKYIGRKLIDKAHRRQKNKKIIRTRVESDWREYWSSSPDVKALIDTYGTFKFTREIVVFAETKTQLNYAEECLQYSFGVLESNMWLNSNIRSKSYKKNIQNKKSIIELRNYISEHVDVKKDSFLYTYSREGL